MKKTLRSRIAAVAVAVVGLGLVQAIPAQADWPGTLFTCNNAAVKVNGYCTQVIGGQVTLTSAAGALAGGANTYYIDFGGATVVSVDTVNTAGSNANDGVNYGNNSPSGTSVGGTVTYTPSNAAIDFPNGTFTVLPNGGATTNINNSGMDADLLASFTSSDATFATGTTITLTKTTAGDTTYTVFYYDSLGRRQVAETNTINWVTATSAYGVSVANSFAYVTADATCATSGTNHQGDVNSYNNNASGATWAPAKTGATDDLFVCMYLRNGLDQPIASGTAGVTVVTTLGQNATGSAKSSTATTVTTANSTAPAAAGTGRFQIDGLTGEIGTTQITIIVTDSLGNVAVMPQLTGTFYGPLASLTLVQNVYTKYSLYAGTPESSTLALGLVGKDAAGNVIDLGQTSAWTYGVLFTVDSDKNTGTPADRTSDSIGGSVSAGFAARTQVAGYGFNFVAGACAYLAYEKLTVTAWGKDVDGNYTVKSGNTVDLYCAGLPKTVAVTTYDTASVAGTEISSVAQGGTFRVQVDAKDANGYPAPDSRTFTTTATDSAAVDYAGSTLTNGKFYVSSTGSTDRRPLITAKNEDGTITVTVYSSGQIVTTKNIKVGTGVNNSGAVSAADAAKAEAAKASAAVAALATQVTAVQTAMASLVASVTATLTAMSAQIAKIMKKLKIK